MAYFGIASFKSVYLSYEVFEACQCVLELNYTNVLGNREVFNRFVDCQSKTNELVSSSCRLS